MSASEYPQWAAWTCPWCSWANNRTFEGLDACEKCGAETATAYNGTTGLCVKWAREPKLHQPRSTGVEVNPPTQSINPQTPESDEPQ